MRYGQRRHSTVKQGSRSRVGSLGLLMWLVGKEKEEPDQVHISTSLNLLSSVPFIVNGEIQGLLLQDS